jgi:hypothetical protein
MADPGRSRRRLLLGLARVAIPLAALTVTITILTHSLQDNDSLSSILSGIATIITLFLTAFDHLRRQDVTPPVAEAVEDLRMRLLEQWEQELHRRVQSYPHERTIPLEWKKYRSTTRSPLDGRFEGDPDVAARELAERFDHPKGKKRMVVLGEPGGGKTFIAIALTVGLLRRWNDDRPVAVYLSLSSWDPIKTSLAKWIVRTLANAYYSGEQATPEKLLLANKLLPVLDGLDELPEHFRRRAVQRINDALTGERMLVVTCRTNEYEETLTGGAPVLLKAPAVEVQPVLRADVLSRLREVPAWADVVHHVQAKPDGPLATALSTPLMLSLFAATYLERDPSGLLDETKFDTKHTVEDHLVNLRLDTAYQDGRWTSKQARKWLTSIAQHMHDHDDRDITWRKLAFRSVPAAAPVIAAAAACIGLFSMSETLLTLTYDGGGIKLANDRSAASVLTSSTPLFALLLGAVAAAAWLGYRHRAEDGPFHDGGRLRGFGRGMTVGFAAVLGPGLVLVLTASNAVMHAYQQVMTLSAQLCTTVALALASGLGVGLHEMLVDHSAAGRTARDERDELKRERTSTFVAAVAAGLVTGALSMLTVAVATPFGARLGERLAGVLGLPRVADLHMPPLQDYLSWPLTFELIALPSGLVTLMFTVMLASSRAWPRLQAARVALACTRRLPWRLHTFETDAAERGLLRKAGTAHQFGHRMLQDQLVTAAADDTTEQQSRWTRIVVVTTAALLLVSVTVVVWAGRPADCRTTNWPGADTRMARTTIGLDTACFALVREQEWEQSLQRTNADAQLLADIKARQPVLGGRLHTRAGNVVVIGEFDRINPTKWHDVLVGISTAQQLSEGSIAVSFVFANPDRNAGQEAVELFDLYEYGAVVNEREVQVNRSMKAVDLNIESSRLLSPGSMQVFAFQEDDLRARAKELGNYEVELLLKRVAKAPAAEALVDDVQADLCTDVNAARLWSASFDMRRRPPDAQLLKEMAACGGAMILVEPEHVRALLAMPDRPREVKINYLEDRSDTILTDCERVTSTAGSTKACVTLMAANESLRVAMQQLPDPLHQ